MYPSDIINDMHDRLLKLEKQNRLMKQFGTAVVIMISALLVMGPGSTKKTLEANEFILKDNANNVRARLSVQEPLDAPDFRPPSPQTLVKIRRPGSTVAS